MLAGFQTKLLEIQSYACIAAKCSPVQELYSFWLYDLCGYLLGHLFIPYVGKI